MDVKEGELALVAHDHSPMQPSRPPRTIDLTIDGPLARADVLELCGRVRGLLGERAAEQLICDVSALTAADLETVDALARLQLTARRGGSRLALDHASPELRQLLCLVGLRDVVPCVESGAEAGREAEDREEPGRVEEEGDPPDPFA